MYQYTEIYEYIRLRYIWYTNSHDTYASTKSLERAIKHYDNRNKSIKYGKKKIYGYIVQAAKQDSIEKGLYSESGSLKEARRNPEQNWDNRLTGDRYSSSSSNKNSYDIKRNRVSSKDRANKAFEKRFDKDLSAEMRNNYNKKSYDMKTYEVNPNERSFSYKMNKRVANDPIYHPEYRDEAQARADKIYNDMKAKHIKEGTVIKKQYVPGCTKYNPRYNYILML